jgi:L-fuconolactonase
MRMGGFGFHERSEPPSSEALAATWRPYIENCINAFGPSRCMFESNFPVDKGSYSYPVFWNACKVLTKGANDAENGGALRRRRGGERLSTAVRRQHLPDRLS